MPRATGTAQAAGWPRPSNGGNELRASLRETEPPRDNRESYQKPPRRARSVEPRGHWDASSLSLNLTAGWKLRRERRKVVQNFRPTGLRGFQKDSIDSILPFATVPRIRSFAAGQCSAQNCGLWSFPTRIRRLSDAPQKVGVRHPVRHPDMPPGQNRGIERGRSLFAEYRAEFSRGRLGIPRSGSDEPPKEGRHRMCFASIRLA